MKQIFRNILSEPAPKFSPNERVFYREGYGEIREGVILSTKANIFHRVTYIIRKGYETDGNLVEILEDDIFKMNE